MRSQILNVLSQRDAMKVSLVDNEGKGAGGIRGSSAKRPCRRQHEPPLGHYRRRDLHGLAYRRRPMAVAKVGSFTVGDDGKGFLEVDNVPTSPSMWIFICREPNSKVTEPTGPTILSGTITL